MSVSPATSPTQLHVLEHALGLDNVTPGQRRRYQSIANCYRNYYVAGPGHHSWDDLLLLEERGLMIRARAPVPVCPESSVFVVTEAGFDVLRMHGRVPAVQRKLDFGGTHA